MQGGKKRSFYNGTPGTRTIVLPLFWCDLCSLKSHLEKPSAIKRERSFLGEKNSLGHDTQKNQTTNSMDLDYTERTVCFKTVSSALVKIQSEGMRLKNKRLCGRSKSVSLQRRGNKPWVVAPTTVMWWGYFGAVEWLRKAWLFLVYKSDLWGMKKTP